MSSSTSVHKKRTAVLALLSLALSVLLTGCEPSSQSRAEVIPYERYLAQAPDSPKTAPPESPPPSPKASQAANQTFDRLTDSLFKKWASSTTINLHYSLKDPAAAGIADYPITFGNYAAEQFREDMNDLKDTRARLNAVDYAALSADRQLTFRILDAYLNTELSAEGLELYAQPLSPTVGIQAQLPVLLAEYDFNSLRDIEDYLKLLAQIDGYFGQILNFEREKADAGLFMSDWMADQVIASCRGYITEPEESFLYLSFSERLTEAARELNLSPEQVKAFEAQNLQILARSFIPAYEQLAQGLEGLKGSGTNEKGVCHFPEGKRYYEYLVTSKIGPSYPTVEHLRRAVAERISTDLLAIQTALTADPGLTEKLKNAEFTPMNPEEMLAELEQSTASQFPELPSLNCQIKQVPSSLADSLSPAFYLTPAIDHYSSHTIYINPKYAGSDLYPTMAHEGYPGHLYQSAYYFSLGFCNLRYLLSFSSYTEGWATYVEHLSYSFKNGLDAACARAMAHNSLATLGLYALLDININYYGWDADETSRFLSAYGIDDAGAAQEIFRAVAANPVNYLQYYAGCLEFLEMREEAERTLGPAFQPKEFHRMLLDIGPAPFTIVREEFSQWLNNR